MTAPVPRQRAVALLLLIGDAFEFSKTTQLGLGVLGGSCIHARGWCCRGMQCSACTHQHPGY